MLDDFLNMCSFCPEACPVDLQTFLGWLSNITYISSFQTPEELLVQHVSSAHHLRNLGRSFTMIRLWNEGLKTSDHRVKRTAFAKAEEGSWRDFGSLAGLLGGSKVIHGPNRWKCLGVRFHTFRVIFHGKHSEAWKRQGRDIGVGMVF